MVINSSEKEVRKYILSTHIQLSFTVLFCSKIFISEILDFYVSGSSANLPSNVSLCEPCGSACKEGFAFFSKLPMKY